MTGRKQLARTDRAAVPVVVVADVPSPVGVPSSRRSVPAWLRAAVHEAVTDAVRLPWGFRNETWRVELTDKRQLAVTRLADRRSGPLIPARIAAVQPRLVMAGLPVPAIESRATRAGTVLISPFRIGVPGPDLLDRPSGPAMVGSLLGSAWQKLARADPAGLDLPDLWASPERLARAAAEWLAELHAQLPRGARARLATAIETLPRSAQGWPAGIVHGDLVPANILVANGALVALFDLEFVRLGDRRLDAAWFDWIVWFHHRSIHPVAWEAFQEAGEIELDSATREAVRVLPAIRLLEILHDLQRGDSARPRWLEHVDAWQARW